MILGIGSDLIDIRRIEKTLERFGERFTNRVFTEIERTKSDKRAERAASYAKRFAAKEACSKALGSGIRMGVAWREMGVVNLPSGKPTIALTGGAAERLQAMAPAGFRTTIDLTITDDYPLAQAFVVISAWPPTGPSRQGRIPPESPASRAFLSLRWQALADKSPAVRGVADQNAGQILSRDKMSVTETRRIRTAASPKPSRLLSRRCCLP